MENGRLNPTVASYIERAYIFLQDGEWKRADEYFEAVLDIEPKNAEAYLGKLLADLKLKRKEEIESYPKSFLKNINFIRYQRFAGANYKEYTSDILLKQAVNIMNTAKTKNQLKSAIEIFEYLGNYADSQYYLDVCKRNLAGNGANGTVKYRDLKELLFKGFLKSLLSFVLAVAVFVSAFYSSAYFAYKHDWSDIKSIACSEYDGFAGLKEDGTVVFAGNYYDNYGHDEVDEWENIVSVVCSDYHTVGLKEDGTVVAVGCNDDGECNVEDWENIVSVACYTGYGNDGSGGYTVGLKEDGTVVAVGLNDDGQCDVEDWEDIVSIACGYGYDYDNSGGYTVGLKEDGTVVATGDELCDVEDWEDIVSIASCESHIVGLKEDGTVVADGCNDCGECDVEDWEDIVSIDCGYCYDYDNSGGYTVGLKKDGTVVAAGKNDYGQCDVEDWRDIISVTCAYDFAYQGGHTVGLKEDGTVVATGNNHYGQCDVDDWEDIVSVACGKSHMLDVDVGGDYTVGLKEDGTVVCTGGILVNYGIEKLVGRNLYRVFLIVFAVLLLALSIYAVFSKKKNKAFRLMVIGMFLLLCLTFIFVNLII